MPIAWTASVWELYAPVTILASVIEGEASDPTGQHAVASTMWNRLESGKFGSSWESVITPLQFCGWKPPAQFAMRLGSELVAGQFTPCTNALYYVSAWYAKEFDWHGTLIGGNIFFSTNPFTGTGAPASYSA